MSIFTPPKALPRLEPADWEAEDKQLRENAAPTEHSEAAWDKGWERLLKAGRQWAQGIRDDDDACQQRAERLFRELTSPTRQQRSWARHQQRALLEVECETIRRDGEAAAIAAAAAAAGAVRQRYQGEIQDRLEAFDLANPIKR